jgi:hypothetical protein
LAHPRRIAARELTWPGMNVAAILLAPLLALHLILTDIAMAGPIFCVWLRRRETRRGEVLAGLVGWRVALWSNAALAAAIVPGVALLAWRWWTEDRVYFAAVDAIPRQRLWFALGELLFYFACMGAYAGLWQRWRDRPVAHGALAVAAASNLLLHFPPLFAIISVLTTRAGALGRQLDASEYRWLLLDGEVLSRVIHVWLGAFAVSGIVVLLLAWRICCQGQVDPAAGGVIRMSGLVALVVTMLQIPSGMWVAMEMPEDTRGRLLGDDFVATALLVLSVLLALRLMHTLAEIALGDCRPRQIGGAVALVLIVVLLMVGMRYRAERKAVMAARGLPPGRWASTACHPGFHLESAAAWGPIGKLRDRGRPGTNPSPE